MFLNTTVYFRPLYAALRAIMHAWLYVLAVLITAAATVQTAAGAAGADAAIDPVALANYEKDLFAQLGLTKRPKIIDRASIVIPDELMDTYRKMMAGHEQSDSVALPTPGLHTKSANTIRSYGHEGTFSLSL